MENPYFARLPSGRFVNLNAITRCDPFTPGSVGRVSVPRYATAGGPVSAELVEAPVEALLKVYFFGAGDHIYRGEDATALNALLAKLTEQGG